MHIHSPHDLHRRIQALRRRRAFRFYQNVFGRNAALGQIGAPDFAFGVVGVAACSARGLYIGRQAFEVQHQCVIYPGQ
jgi:hypothetical protein